MPNALALFCFVAAFSFTFRWLGIGGSSANGHDFTAGRMQWLQFVGPLLSSGRVDKWTTS